MTAPWAGAARLLGDSLAVELSALTRATLVRIQVPQPLPQGNPAKSVAYRVRRRSVPQRCTTRLSTKRPFRGPSRGYGAPTEGTPPCRARTSTCPAAATATTRADERRGGEVGESTGSIRAERYIKKK